jgi:hypothetical protein
MLAGPESWVEGVWPAQVERAQAKIMALYHSHLSRMFSRYFKVSNLKIHRKTYHGAVTKLHLRQVRKEHRATQKRGNQMQGTQQIRC